MKIKLLILSIVLTATVLPRSASGQEPDVEKALQAALPFAEAGITADRSILDTPLDQVDYTAVDSCLEAIAPLVPYSSAIEAYSTALQQFAELSRAYAECMDFDTKPYSAAMVDSIQSRLLNIFDTGDPLLNTSQKDSINSLYEFTANYLPAVECFDALLKKVDDEVELFRGKDDGDKLCANEIERVMKESEADTAKINQFRYLSDLLARYVNELNDSPRSLTPAIREELARMTTDECPHSDMTNDK